MSTYYLAGPMSGIKSLNFPLFFSAAEDLRKAGYDIVSPAEMDDEQTVKDALKSEGENTGDGTWGDFLSRDVKIIADSVDGIIFLPNWHRSNGARLEAYVALVSGFTNEAKQAYKFRYYDPDTGSCTKLHADVVKERIINGLTEG